MGDSTIEWTDKTWNPVTGCTKVSEGCRHCYAERVFPRTAHGQRVPVNSAAGVTDRDPDPVRDDQFRQRLFTDVRTHEENRLEQPLHWRKPARIFVNSMSDLFHEDVPFEFIDRVFAVMALCQQHTFQILTKRAGRMREYLTHKDVAIRWLMQVRSVTSGIAGVSTTLVDKEDGLTGGRLPHVWLGVSVENQKTADERIPLLLKTPAAVRFVSYEPALGWVDFMPWISQPCTKMATHACSNDFHRAADTRLDWIIVGGESGPGARPFNIQWARDVVEQCKAAGVSCFVKQLGSLPIVIERAWRHGNGLSGIMGHLLSATNGTLTPDGFVPLKYESKKGGDWNEWPEDLRVREFPQ